jgi:hypothetical protein
VVAPVVEVVMAVESLPARFPLPNQPIPLDEGCDGLSVGLFPVGVSAHPATVAAVTTSRAASLVLIFMSTSEVRGVERIETQRPADSGRVPTKTFICTSLGAKPLVRPCT